MGFDPKNPIGSGPFKMIDMKPGEQFKWDAFADYWNTPPYVDTLTMIEFADDTARINALQSGQIQAMSQLPKSQAKVIEATDGLALLNAETGAWRPFTMRIDVKPFDDVRVRQAFRLIVDRQQMIDQAYSGLGRRGQRHVRPVRRRHAATSPQRVQDIEQAKSLLKQAGYDNNLTVELVTSEGALGGDEVAAAQVFAEQAKAAGVTVKIKKTDAGVFYGDDYLSWPFAQDFWATRGYLAQASQGTMPDAPYNETHWENAEWLSLRPGGVHDGRRRRSATRSSAKRSRSSSTRAATSSGRGATRSTPTPRRPPATSWTSSAVLSAGCTSRKSTSSETGHYRQDRRRTPYSPLAPAAGPVETARRQEPRASTSVVDVTVATLTPPTLPLDSRET